MATIVLRKFLARSASITFIRGLKFSIQQNAIRKVTVPNFQTRSINRELQLSSTVSYQKDGRMCWKCQQKVAKVEFVCSKCNSLQTPDVTLNHFELFGIEETFDVDIPDLMNKFKNLQRRLHPDKFSQKNKTEQDYSAIYSAQINRAYQTLLKPVKRGLYILETKGKPLQEESVTMSPEFLTEIMEINEILAETKSMEKVKAIASIYGAKMEKLLTKLSRQMKNEDWEEAQKTLAELKYYANIDEKAKSILNEEAMGKL